MATAVQASGKKNLWITLGWFGVLMLLCYAPILYSLAGQWSRDADMGHGFFVPVLSAFIIWQRRDELLATKTRPCWWGLPVVILGMVMAVGATLGVELFLTRLAVVVTATGMVWLLGGTLLLKKLRFPLFLLLFMIPIPAIVLNRITFPLQILASQLAASALSTIGIAVFREGNILELPNQRLSVVEACSGIRSLLALTFLTLVYGYFFEKRTWMRVVLFLATIPVAIIANGLRVTMTGILGQVRPELAEGFFHESTGWVIFMIALVLVVILHRVLVRLVRRPAVGISAKGSAGR